MPTAPQRRRQLGERLRALALKPPLLLAPRDALQALHAEVDQLVCLQAPAPFFAVGEHYLRFGQVDDDQVIAALIAAPQAADEDPLNPQQK